MYEQDPQKLPTARGTVLTDPAVRLWSVANRDLFAVQAIALMDHAGVPFPQGMMEDLVSIRIPAAQFSGVDTEFHPWSNQEIQVALARGGPRNLGEIRLGDNVQTVPIVQEFPGLIDNQIRVFQIRGLIHELFHALDFGDVTRTLLATRTRR